MGIFNLIHKAPILFNEPKAVTQQQINTRNILSKTQNFQAN